MDILPDTSVSVCQATDTSNWAMKAVADWQKQVTCQWRRLLVGCVEAQAGYRALNVYWQVTWWQ